MKAVYRAVFNISPSIADWLRVKYHKLRGRNVAPRTLKRMDSAGPAEVLDRKDNFDTPGIVSLLLSEMALRLPSLSASNAKIAFVTCLPPADTGIATCSFYSWFGSERDVDIYAPNVHGEMYGYITGRLERSSAARIRVFDSRAIFTGIGIGKYSRIVIAMGNSDHHIFSFDIIRMCQILGVSDKIELYIHDPCCLNIAFKGSALSFGQFRVRLFELYRTKMHQEDGKYAKFECWEAEFSRRGVMGLRVFQAMGVNHYIVNSNAARVLVENDLDEFCTKTPIVRTFFHPVFLPGPAFQPSASTLTAPILFRDEGEEIVVGTFGVPGASKMTEVIFDACVKLTAGGRKIKLVIAGFGARRYVARSIDILGVDGLTVVAIESPTDHELVLLMADVTVAVQLRRQSLGESSGVVPQLLALGRRVVVSDIGAFSEYGKCVYTVPAACSSDNVAQCILEASKGCPNIEEIERYVQSHSVQRWRAQLFEALEDELGTLN